MTAVSSYTVDGGVLVEVLVRVLVVDDFQPFRQVVTSILQAQADLQVISEASNASQAVQMADELQPEVILLDIGLPDFNGIDAARQIRELSPLSKILFVTQGSSVDVMQEGLGLGAHGFLVKSDAGRELVAAVRTVLQGETFVSRRLAGK
jgi:DNA-binding NarL/FixJ family response regulator